MAGPEKPNYYLWDLTENSTMPARREIGIGLAENLSPQEVLQKALQIKLPQIIQKNTFQPESEMDSALLLYHKTSTLFDLPLSAILRPQTVSNEQEDELRLMEKEITSSNQKKATLEILEGHLSSICKATLIPDVILVADEILSNAIYNAPFVNAENTNYGASRHSGEVNFVLPAKFMVGHDEERLVVAVADQYGALNIEKLIRRIESCYSQGATASINHSIEGGAQIGSFLIFQSCLSYYVAVEPGQRTLVAATFPLLLNRKKREMLSKNIHIFKV